MTRQFVSIGAALLVAALAVGCGEHEAEGDDDHNFSGPSAVSPTPTPSPTPEASPTPTPSPTPTSASVAYLQDIQPIMRTDCTRCHRSFDTYAGVMGFVAGATPDPLSWPPHSRAARCTRT